MGLGRSEVVMKFTQICSTPWRRVEKSFGTVGSGHTNRRRIFDDLTLKYLVERPYSGGKHNNICNIMYVYIYIYAMGNIYIYIYMYKMYVYIYISFISIQFNMACWHIHDFRTKHLPLKPPSFGDTPRRFRKEVPR